MIPYAFTVTICFLVLCWVLILVRFDRRQDWLLWLALGCLVVLVGIWR